MSYRLCVVDIDRTKSDKHGAGLCSDCVHARHVESERGSAFCLCQYSLIDPTFVKYPRLPVTRCTAHEPRHISDALERHSRSSRSD